MGCSGGLTMPAVSCSKDEGIVSLGLAWSL